jgi:hypothetical protein
MSIVPLLSESIPALSYFHAADVMSSVFVFGGVTVYFFLQAELIEDITIKNAERKIICFFILYYLILINRFERAYDAVPGKNVAPPVLLPNLITANYLQAGVRILAVKWLCAVYDVKYTIRGGLSFYKTG